MGSQQLAQFSHFSITTSLQKRALLSSHRLGFAASAAGQCRPGSEGRPSARRRWRGRGGVGAACLRVGEVVGSAGEPYRTGNICVAPVYKQPAELVSARDRDETLPPAVTPGQHYRDAKPAGYGRTRCHLEWIQDPDDDDSVSVSTARDPPQKAWGVGGAGASVCCPSKCSR